MEKPEKIIQILSYYRLITMSIENVSSPMEQRFYLLDEMVKQGYIEPIKPSISLLPSFCFSPNKTAKFDNASQEIRKKFTNMFSWYAFLLGPFAFTQTRLAQDYFIIVCIYTTILAFLPPSLNFILHIVVDFFISKFFIFSRYYQYKKQGKCPTNLDVFSTIFQGIVYLFIAILPSIIIEVLIYP